MFLWVNLGQYAVAVRIPSVVSVGGVHVNRTLDGVRNNRRVTKVRQEGLDRVPRRHGESHGV